MTCVVVAKQLSSGSSKSSLFASAQTKMTVTYSQVPSQSQGIGTIPVTADTYRTEEVSGENDGRKAGAIDQDVSSMPKPADDDEERMGGAR